MILVLTSRNFGAEMCSCNLRTGEAVRQVDNCSLHFRPSRRVYPKIRKRGERGEEEKQGGRDRREGVREREKELKRWEQQSADAIKGKGKTWEEALTGEGGKGNIRHTEVELIALRVFSKKP